MSKVKSFIQCDNPQYDMIEGLLRRLGRIARKVRIAGKARTAWKIRIFRKARIARRVRLRYCDEDMQESIRMCRYNIHSVNFPLHLVNNLYKTRILCRWVKSYQS